MNPLLWVDRRAGRPPEQARTPVLPKGAPAAAPSIHHSITPSLHHSITPSLHHSVPPLLPRPNPPPNLRQTGGAARDWLRYGAIHDRDRSISLQRRAGT